MIAYCALLFSLNAWSYTPKSLLHAKSFRKTVVGKRDYFVSSGLFYGGEVTDEGWTLKSIRQGKHVGFQRVALEWSQIPVPYFQVAIQPESGFIQVTLWGRAQFAESARGYLQKPDAWLKPIDGFDQVFWSAYFSISSGATVEVFLHEMHPILVMDVREGLPRANSSTP